MMTENIKGKLLAGWALLTFIISFCIVFIPSMFCWLVPDPAGQKLFIGIARTWMRVWLPLVGCRFTIKGREHFKSGETFIVTCNHNSMMDIPLSSAFIPGANKTIAKSSFTKVPLFGFYYARGAVLVNRKSEKSRKASYEKMKAVLARGIHMCIYPEGTRNRTPDPLKKFHDGAFRLSIDTGRPVIPAVILHTKKVLPAGKGFFFRPARMAMHFLPPVHPGGKTTDQLREEVFSLMQEYYILHR